MDAAKTKTQLNKEIIKLGNAVASMLFDAATDKRASAYVGAAAQEYLMSPKPTYRNSKKIFKQLAQSPNVVVRTQTEQDLLQAWVDRMNQRRGMK